MAAPITLSIPHTLGRDEARRRIDSGFANVMQQMPGGASLCSQRWEGDRLIFSVTAVGQTIRGVVDVLDAMVMMEIELPGLLGVIAGSLTRRLKSAGQLLLTRK
jgi:Putative polyhydroxyalkanoic acid system protein (PHA_gran_rgn)